MTAARLQPESPRGRAQRGKTLFWDGRKGRKEGKAMEAKSGAGRRPHLVPPSWQCNGCPFCSFREESCKRGASPRPLNAAVSAAGYKALLTPDDCRLRLAAQ
jgi:hypothetical protein